MADIKIETVSDSIEAKVLGQRVSAPNAYDPSILVAVPRETNRIPYEITDSDFEGYDVWNAYECTCLTSKGYPIYFALRIKYSCHSKFIVESKSLKLYFNSFNNYVIGDDYESSTKKFLEFVENDLSALLETPVEIEIIDQECQNGFDLVFEDITNLIDFSKVNVTKYKEDSSILREGPYKEFDIYMNGLLSNCQVTGAPDHAVILIEYCDDKVGVDLESLFEYIISHRKENRFHEATLETIFKHVKEKFNPKHLSMQALYTRRGGIDINPFRTTESNIYWPSYRSFYQ